jgi:ABC-2 type transport system permease protein
VRLLQAELLKIRTAPRTTLGLVLGLFALVGVGALATAGEASGTSLDAAVTWDVIGVASIASVFTLIFGILVVTWEYRHGTITQTFLSTPARDRVIAVKALVAGLVGAALVVPALLLMLVIAELWVGNRLDFTGEDVERAGRVFLASAIVAVLGMEIGAITGRQLGAIVLAFAWAIFAEPALAFWASLEDYLPLHAIFGGILGDPETGISFGRGLLTIAVYVAALGVAAIAVTRRRDIT